VVSRPLEGVRVLSMEQAAALPYATRHLYDLGAEVIRVESHLRARGATTMDAFRGKRRLAIDLNAEAGPDLFRRVAAECDIVAHNFTPRVMRKYGIDYEGIRAVRPDVIYVSLTGYGTTGPWGERPLFGPGAEAVSGHNWLIGDPDAWPGRPGTIVYADNTCGLNTVFAILAALDHRDDTGEGQHIDISLYETAISQLGGVVAERALGAPLPTRVANEDANYVLHGVFAVAGHDRSVAISATEAQRNAVTTVLDISILDDESVAAAVSGRDGAALVADLQAVGVAASVVSDAADQLADAHLWARRYFGVLDTPEGPRPHAGPAFGGGPREDSTPPHHVGEDNAHVLGEIAGLDTSAIAELEAGGVIGSVPMPPPRPSDPPERVALRLERGELSRVDDDFDAWRSAAGTAR
jgi:benzylsuccinate CoA-transferase BbsF subunit